MTSFSKRFLKLQLGLLLVGLGMGLMVNSHLGSDPWTVFHIGASNQLNMGIGTFIQLSGTIFLGLGWLLRQPIGIGSLFNMFLLGPWLEFFIKIVPEQTLWFLALPQLMLGILILSFAIALYITADLGAGPRDSVLLGLSLALGLSIRSTRMGMEITVLIFGYFLGGPVGIGTIIFALILGPLMQFFLQRLKNPPLSLIPQRTKNLI